MYPGKTEVFLRNSLLCYEFCLAAIEGIRELLSSRRFIIILVFTATRDPCKLVERDNSVFFYTATGWRDIGARMLDLARQHGGVWVQLTFIGGPEPLDAVVTVTATMAVLRLVSGNIAKHWEDTKYCGTYCESPGASGTKFRGTNAPAHRVCAARELGVQQGLIIAERAEVEHRRRQRRRGRSGSECAALLSGGRGA
ncbi:amino acid transporter [Trypanosoma cruzi]|nr:amino acid transporter [Trypanosoma cruzi]